MKEYSTDKIRNVVLASHSGAGKTILCEAFLHSTGATTRMGKIEDGTTVSDFDEEEVRRTISLSTSVIPVEYRDVKINVLDTPGYTDFIGEVISAMRVADAVILMVDAVNGLEVGTEIAMEYSATSTCRVFLSSTRWTAKTRTSRNPSSQLKNFQKHGFSPSNYPGVKSRTLKVLSTSSQ